MLFNVDDAGDGDGDSADVATAEVALDEGGEVEIEGLFKGAGILGGCELETFETNPVGRKEGEEGLGGADVNRQEHTFIIT